MGKFLPRKARPVMAFQWKSNSTTCVYELISFLHKEGHDFKLITFPGSQGISIIIGFDVDDQVRADEKQWIVFEGEEINIMDTKDFFEAYETMGTEVGK